MELPKSNVKLREFQGNREIWDPVRKKFVSFTPEEFIRQCLVNYLMEKKVPPGLISIEKMIRFHQVNKRYDLVVFNSSNEPVLLAECKAPDVALNPDTFFQAGVYNSVLQAGFLILTNGPQFLIYRKTVDGKFLSLETLPEFTEW